MTRLCWQKPQRKQQTTWHKVQRSVHSHWSLTSKQNCLEQPRAGTDTGLDVQHQQNL
jgi:hypothetical protein